jgi:hypothetical protein
MYTEKEIAAIVQQYRTPEQSVPLLVPEDSKKKPNDILISYLLSDVTIDKDHLADLLLRPSQLEQWLSLTMPEKKEQPPALPDDLDYDSHPVLVAQAIRMHTGFYAECLGEELIVGLPVPKLFMYPSGQKFEYAQLKLEYTANMSIFTEGFCVSPSAIYVRQQYLLMMRALKKALANEPLLEPYQEYIKNFDCALPGLVLAHEFCELDLLKRDALPEDFLESELLVERNAKKFLKEQGMPLAFYEMRHLLRAGPDQPVSQFIVENNFDP